MRVLVERRGAPRATRWASRGEGLERRGGREWVVFDISRSELPDLFGALALNVRLIIEDVPYYVQRGALGKTAYVDEKALPGPQSQEAPEPHQEPSPRATRLALPGGTAPDDPVVREDASDITVARHRGGRPGWMTIRVVRQRPKKPRGHGR